IRPMCVSPTTVGPRYSGAGSVTGSQSAGHLPLRPSLAPHLQRGVSSGEAFVIASPELVDEVDEDIGEIEYTGPAHELASGGAENGGALFSCTPHSSTPRRSSSASIASCMISNGATERMTQPMMAARARMRYAIMLRPSALRGARRGREPSSVAGARRARARRGSGG